MARKPRVHLPGGYYHVMMRGNVGSDLFYSDADRSRFLLLMQEGIERYGHRVHAYCLMTNHVHLLIQVGSVPLSRIIQNLGFRYTRYINRKRGEVGHLFQGRYKAILIEADRYLLELVRYIHCNPVRAGLCAAAADSDWSSYNAYAGKVVIPWLHQGEVLGRFSEDTSRARNLLHIFTEEGHGEARRTDFHAGSHQGRLLGNDAFAEQSLNAAGEIYDGAPAVVEIIDAVCRELQTDKALMYEKGRKRDGARLRAMAAFIVQDMDGVSMTALAAELGRDLSAVSRAAGRMYKLLPGDEQLQMQVENIRSAVQKSSQLPTAE